MRLFSKGGDVVRTDQDNVVKAIGQYLYPDPDQDDRIKSHYFTKVCLCLVDVLPIKAYLGCNMQGQHVKTKELLSLEQLPPLSPTASRLLEVAVDPDLDIEQLAGIIEQDPPLSGRILGLANSAFFGQRTEVLSIKLAIIRVLGLNMVRGLSLSMALAGSFNTSSCQSFDLKNYWMMALGSAVLARKLSLSPSLQERPDPDMLYMSGLLHTLGELALVHLYPQQMDDIFSRYQRDPSLDLGPLISAVFEVNHWQVFEVLGQRWHLPDSVVETVSQIPNPAYDGHFLTSVRLLRASRLWLRTVMAGEPAALLVTGVDPDDCKQAMDYFLSKMDSLEALVAQIS